MNLVESVYAKMVTNRMTEVENVKNALITKENVC